MNFSELFLYKFRALNRTKKTKIWSSCERKVGFLLHGKMGRERKAEIEENQEGKNFRGGFYASALFLRLTYIISLSLSFAHTHKP